MSGKNGKCDLGVGYWDYMWINFIQLAMLLIIGLFVSFLLKKYSSSLIKIVLYVQIVCQIAILSLTANTGTFQTVLVH